MGWFKDLGQSLKNSASDVINSTYDNTKDLYEGYVDLFSGGVSKDETKQLLKQQGSLNNFSANITSITRPKSHVISTQEYDTLFGNRNSAMHNYIMSKANPFPTHRGSEKHDTKKIVDTDGEDILGFKIPDWTYADFINERAIFQKNLFTAGAEPGWFYFKIFFNFDTQYGLLGGLLNDDSFTSASNSAAKYLYYGSSLYTHERPNDRIEALHKFASILSFINTNTPWFFKSVKGLNNVQQPLIREFSKDKFIELECSVDSIDMRLNTLMDLYKFAVYDDINCKEIIPENLRKFDMSIVIFQTPIRYYHTAMKSEGNGTFNYKSMSPIQGGTSSNYDNVMSFKLYTFINCEIDPSTLGVMVPGDVKNEQPFQMGSGTIRIKYDRVYQHTMNEFNEMLFGSDGFYYNRMSLWSDSMVINSRPATQINTQDKRYTALQESMHTAKMSNTKADAFKKLVDASEAICGHNLLKFGGNVLGNLAGIQDDLQIKHFDDNGKLLPRDNGVIRPSDMTDYFKYKLSRIKQFATAGRGENISVLSKMGASYLLGLLGSSYDTMNATLVTKEGTDHGFLSGYANTGIVRRTFSGDSKIDYQYSKYFKDKLELLHKNDKPGIVNFSTIPQNRTHLYISGEINKNISFYGATLHDKTLTSEWSTEVKYIAGAEDKQLQSKYTQQKIRASNDKKAYSTWRDKFDNITDVIHEKFIPGAEDKQVGSEYHKKKLDAIKDKKAYATYRDKFDNITDVIHEKFINGAEDKQIGSEYHQMKLDAIKDKKAYSTWRDKFGNVYDVIHEKFINGAEDKQLDSDYYKSKLHALNDGNVDNTSTHYISGSHDKQTGSEYQNNKLSDLIKGKFTNKYIAGAEDKQVGTGYNNDKINELKSGSDIQNGHIAGAEDKQVVSDYQNQKLTNIKSGTVTGQFIAGSEDKQVDSEYQNEKINELKRDSVDTKFISGAGKTQIGSRYHRNKLNDLKQNTVDTHFITGSEDKQLRTIYSDDKLDDIKQGTIESMYIAGAENTKVGSNYYEDKLHALNDDIISFQEITPYDATNKYVVDKNYKIPENTTN